MPRIVDLSTNQRWLRISLGIIVLAVVLLAIARIVAPSVGSFRLELAKAFVQLAVITLLGGAVAATLRYVESLREENRRLNEYWAGLFREVVAAYNEIKTVRRTLRAFGFRKTPAGSLSAEQAVQFWAQMTSLLQSQLSLERVERELRTSPEADATHAREAIQTVETYVHDIVKEWEDYGLEITEGVASNRLEKLEELRSFLGPADQGFRENATEPMELLEGFIRRKLGPPTHGKSRSSGHGVLAVGGAPDPPDPMS